MNVTRVGWEWRPPMGTEATDVLPGGNGPLILLRDGAVALDGTDGEDLPQTVTLDAETGEIADEDSGFVEPPGGGVPEHGREPVAEALDLPEECVVSQATVHDRLLLGAFGCLEDAESGPLGWDHIGARATVAAIDP